MRPGSPRQSWPRGCGGLCRPQIISFLLSGGWEDNTDPDQEAPGVVCCSAPCRGSKQHAQGPAGGGGGEQGARLWSAVGTEGWGPEAASGAFQFCKYAICPLFPLGTLSFTLLSTLPPPALFLQVTSYSSFQFLFTASRNSSLRFPLPPTISDSHTRQLL